MITSPAVIVPKAVFTTLLKVGIKRFLMKKLTQSEVIDRFRDIHGNSYDYSLVDYKNKRSKVTLVCPVHGEFRITPDRVLFQRAGCPKCGLLKRGRRKLTTPEFVERSVIKHGDKYDYSLSEYVDQNTPIKIICSDHGIFEQYPANHYHLGHNCPMCANLEKSGGYETLGDDALNGIKSAYLYTIKLYNNIESFHKIGVTVSIEDRIKSLTSSGYKCDLIQSVRYPSMLHAFRIEQSIHSRLRKFRYIPKIKFGGYTECFTEINL